MYFQEYITLLLPVTMYVYFSIALLGLLFAVSSHNADAAWIDSIDFIGIKYILKTSVQSSSPRPEIMTALGGASIY